MRELEKILNDLKMKLIKLEGKPYYKNEDKPNEISYLKGYYLIEESFDEDDWDCIFNIEDFEKKELTKKEYEFLKKYKESFEEIRRRKWLKKN